MKNVIQFEITKADDGYTAVAVGHPIITQGVTFEETEANIREAVELYVHGENITDLGLAQTPSIIASYEVLKPVYA